MTTRCGICNGLCTNKPAWKPTAPPKYEETNIFSRGEWAIDLVQGYLHHHHGRKNYGVFNHYWSEAQGFPHREPMLACTYCCAEIPDKEYEALKAAHKLLQKIWK